MLLYNKLCVSTLIISLISKSIGYDPVQNARRLNFYDSFFDTSNDNNGINDLTKKHVDANGSYSISDTNFTKAENLLDKLIHLITYRFSLHDKYRSQLFDVAANMNNNTWDIMKYKLAEKLVANSISKRSFLMIFGGSSVTAGHDNYFKESYPIVFERRMKPIFEALGLDLIVHNIAQGSNDCYPYDLCYEAMGGQNPDWIGWEQSYNCGRDNGVFELMGRMAAWNKAVLYFSASGGFIPDNCGPSKDPIPWIDERWSPELSGINNVSRINADDVTKKKAELNEWFLDGNSAGKFTNALKDPAFSGVAAHGFNWFANSRSKCFNDEKGTRGCNAIDVRGKCQSEGGPNWLVKEAAIFTCTTQGKKWHPTAGMHLMRGEVIAFRYSYILLDAIYMVQEDLKLKSQNELIVEYRSKLSSLQPDNFGSPSFCGKICLSRPICYTDFEPNYNPSRKLSNILVQAEFTLNSMWSRMQYKKDVPGLSNNKAGYLDRRPVYESTGINSTIFLKLAVKSQDIALVCGYPVKESLKYATFYLDVNFTIHDEVLGGKYYPSKRLIKWTDRKYFNGECTQLLNLPFGEHILTIKMDQDRGPYHTSVLSYVITY